MITAALVAMLVVSKDLAPIFIVQDGTRDVTLSSIDIALRQQIIQVILIKMLQGQRLVPEVEAVPGLIATQPICVAVRALKLQVILL